MKIINQNLKQGTIKIQIENTDDLWYLSTVIDPGDSVAGKTFRKISKAGKDERNTNVTKKSVFLKITAEKIDFSHTSLVLKVLGAITEGPEDVAHGTHHSFNLEEGSIISITKQQWLGFQLQKIKDASKAKKSSILICVFDREEAYFALLKTYGYELILHLEGDVVKKGDVEAKKGNFYVQIIGHLREYIDRYKLQHVILASPSFWKQELLKELKDDEVKKRIVQATCSEVTEKAINEVVKRPEVQQALQQERIGVEIQLVEELLKRIHQDGNAAYGKEQVKNAADAGAIECLLIADSYLLSEREEGRFDTLDQVMKSVENNKGKIHLISHEHDGGKKLIGLSGIGALLRYRLG